MDRREVALAAADLDDFVDGVVADLSGCIEAQPLARFADLQLIEIIEAPTASARHSSSSSL